jgi:3-phenylpropionate/trans-cinnamate dioxygenase ferredoxin reductase subunit
MSGPIVIVGGGLAGQRCAETLRRCGCEEPIVMVCGEPHRPYDRPPLSKEALFQGDIEDTLSFRPREWYEQKAVRLSLGVAARRLDQRDKLIELADGSRLRYGRLLIATGARPRRLAMFDGFENVGGLRTLEDAATLRTALVPGSRLLVIGAGFIGQEAASAARQAGVHTTIVEAGASPLASVLGTELGDWFAQLHRESGVELLLGEQVVAPRGEGRRLQAVTLAGGRTIASDHVLLGIGVKPDLDWLEGAALQRTGVRTDLDGRTDAPDVYAAGDAAGVFDPQLGTHVLGNHWESAGRQGSRVAKAMLGLDPGPASISSFWSDLYGTRVQYLGRASLADEVSFDGDLASRRFTATFTREGEPVAVLLAGRPEMLPHARALLTPTTERTFA